MWLFCYGRIKDIIKCSGENISAREVESYSPQHPTVFEVAVVDVPDELRKEELKTFIILNNNKLETQDLAFTILEHCQNKLADHAIAGNDQYCGFLSSLED